MFGSQGFAEAPFAGPARANQATSGGGTGPQTYELIATPASYSSSRTTAWLVFNRQLRITPTAYAWALSSATLTTSTTAPIPTIPTTPSNGQRLQVGKFFFKWSGTDSRWAADGSTGGTTPVLPTPTVIYKNIADHLNVIDNAVGRMFMAPFNEVIKITEAIRSQVVYRLNDNLALSETISHDGATFSANFRVKAEPWIFQPLQGVRPVDVLALKEVVRYLASISFADQTLIADAITIIGRWQKDDGFGVGENASYQFFEPPPQDAGLTADTTSVSESRSMGATLSQTEVLANLLDATSVAGALAQSDTFGISETQTPRGLISATDTLAISEARTIDAVYRAAESFAIAELARSVGALPYAESVVLADAQSNNAGTNGSGDSLGMVDNTSILGQMYLGDLVGFGDSASAQGVYFKSETIPVADALMLQATQAQDEALGVAETWDHDGATLSSNFTPVVKGGPPAPLQDPNANASSSASDAAGVADAQSVAGSMQVADATPLNDARSLAGSVAAADSAGVVDGYNLQATMTSSESIALADARVLQGSLSVSDATSMADSSSVQGSVIRAESVALAEAVGQQATYLTAEAVALAEARSMQGTYGTDDSADISDNATAAGSTPNADATGVSESFSYNGAFTKADTVALAEARTFAGTFLKTDTAAIAESWGVQATYVKTDTLAVTETTSNQSSGGSSIAVKQTSNALRTSTQSTVAATFSTAVTAGSTLLIMIALYDSDVTSIVGSRNGAFTRVGYAEDTNYNSMEVWAKFNCAAGTETVTVTPANPGGSYISGIGIEVSGITALDKVGVNYNSYTATASGANASAASFVLSGVVHDDGGNAGWGTPSGYTLINRENDADNYTASQWSYKIVSAIETSSATVTSTSAATVVDSMIITFKP